jgi:uncharacterized protein YyaL (SSP411 family)
MKKTALCLNPDKRVISRGKHKRLTPRHRLQKLPPLTHLHQNLQLSQNSPHMIVMSNCLINEASPYLLQHAHNPVDWFPWGSEAFEKAKREDKPIFLSIGYATCHWCHVMERESFENKGIAQFLNKHFVSIKVDREERPDIDKIYMTAVQAMTGGGGWPLSVWLTPDLQPFYGGTYFPPESSHGRPGLIDLLQRLVEIWKDQRNEVNRSTESLKPLYEPIRQQLEIPKSHHEDILRQAGDRFKRSFDHEFGGFGTAPKFPRPVLPSFLLRYADCFQDMEAIDQVEKTCLAMILGGIHDQLGGGFHRYSVDQEWLVPHFEKMLYDNAQLMGLFADLHTLRPQPWLAEAVENIHTYLTRDMLHPEGAFYSAEDADSEGREGLFYVWTLKELKEVLSESELAFAIEIFGVTEDGNFYDHSDPDPLPGLNVLSIVYNPPKESDPALYQQIKNKLLAHRSKRKRPLCDDKILTSWNALMISGYAKAARVWDRTDYLQAALNAFSFIEKHLMDGKTCLLYHRYRNNQRDDQAFLEDYAFLLDAILELHATTLETNYLSKARNLADQMIELFYDQKDGGFFHTTKDAAHLIARMKEDYDGAEPSGNSVAILCLLKLSVLLDQSTYREVAQKSLDASLEKVIQQVGAVPHLLSALDFAEAEPCHAVITGDPKTDLFRKLKKTAQQIYHPHLLIMQATHEHPADWVRKLAETSSEPTVYFCSNGNCKLPTCDPEELKRLLQRVH